MHICVHSPAEISRDLQLCACVLCSADTPFFLRKGVYNYIRERVCVCFRVGVLELDGVNPKHVVCALMRSLKGTADHVCGRDGEFQGRIRLCRKAF